MPEKHPLVDRYPQMPGQKDVRHEVGRITQQRRHQVESGVPKKEALKVPQRPAEKIDAFLDVLKKIHMVRDPKVTERIKQSLHRQYCLDPSKPMPDSWFRTQAQMAEDQGHGLKDDVYRTLKAAYELGGDARSEVETQKQALIRDQESSLDKWYDYLSRPDTPYPMWFRYFAFKNVTQLGSYSKETHSFARRSNDTVGAFPELNAEALAYVAESLARHYGLSMIASEDDKVNLDDPRMKDLLKSQASFGDMYAHALEYCTPASAEMLSVTDGKWVTNPKGTPGIELSSTLDGHGTGWCVAGENYAGQYLADGDFMVFYTKDADDNYSIPRIGIPMNGTAGEDNYSIREVRGIREGQNMEDVLNEVLDAKLTELPGSEEYMYAREDMAYLTDIWKRHTNGEQLNGYDLRFLYEIDHAIVGFGEYEDPRIGELLRSRDWMTDMRVIYEATSDSDLVLRLIDAGRGDAVALNFDKFYGLDASVANKLIDDDWGSGVAHYLDRFQGLDHTVVANKLIDVGRGGAVARNLDKFQGLDASVANKLIDADWGDAVARNLDKFQGLDHTALANRLIDAGKVGVLLHDLDKFQGLDHTALANRLIDAGKGGMLLHDLDKFQGLDASVANKLIDAGEGLAVDRNLGRFQGLDASVANKLIDAGEGYMVAHHLDKFQGLDHTEVANKLIDVGKGGEVVRNLDKFQGLDHTQIAIKLIDTGQRGVFLRNLDKFQGIDNAEINKRF